MSDRTYHYKERKKSLLDPRSKILLLILIAVFVLGGAGGEMFLYVRIFLSVIPFVLLITAKKYKTALVGVIIAGIGFALQLAVQPFLSGLPSFAVMLCGQVITKFVPSIMMANYAVSTTTVIEFMAAMGRMKLSDKITIPMTVMFRFVPTIKEEFSSINSAMKMRDISLTGKKKGHLVEYRIVPVIMCCMRINDELSASALTRGLGGDVKRTNVCMVKFGIADIIVFILSAAIFAAYILEKVGVISW